VEMMDGAIGVTSVQGSGSTFWISLILPTPDLIEPAPEREVAAIPTRRLHLLVADDNPANRKLVTALLEPFDMRIDTVENGAEAVVAASAFPYDLILMDMQMPVMDGLTATAELRAVGNDTPILALTANVLPEYVERCYAAGMQGHAEKPIMLDALLAAIDAHARPGREEDAATTRAA